MTPAGGVPLRHAPIPPACYPTRARPAGRRGGCAVVKRTKRTPKTVDKLLDAFRSGSAVGTACAIASIGRSTYYEWRDGDPDFAARCDEAIDYGTDVLEDVARNRAVRDSDTLLIFLLKARRPEKYRDVHKHEHSGPDGAPIPIRTIEVVAPAPEAP